MTTAKRTADLLAFSFVLIILAFACAGPMAELVEWVVGLGTDGFDELSSRKRRIAVRNHWLGQIYRSYDNNFLSSTGMLLGLPIIFSYGIMLLTLHKRSEFHWLNWALAVFSTLLIGYWITKLIAIDGGVIAQLETYAGIPVDYLAFVLSSALTLYLTYRLYGGFIVGFCVFWVAYFFLRGYVPDTGEGFVGQVQDLFRGSDDTPLQNLRSMTLTFWAETGGIFGQPLQVVSGTVLVFIAFGAVLMASGAGNLLLKIANLLTGRFTGGAAHAAVASSALFGTLSGAAISNVVSTGVMTIPVIKKSGFKASFAGAVEAAASTGGQVMPPVMGVVAFFVAGQIGLEYRYIVLAAIVPALFYYLGVFLTIYFEARKQGIGGLPEDQRIRLNRIEYLQCLVFIIPLGVLSYYLFSQPSVPRAGFYGFVAALLTALVLFPEFRSGKRVYLAFVEAGRMSASIVIIVASIGLIVGLIQSSGFSIRLSELLTIVAGGPLFLVLVVVAVGAIVLGMGLPPGATYFIIVIALSSGISAIGIPPLTLHLFVVFFAVISTVTPPVALAAFAAAPIAGSNPMSTGFQASRLAIAGFIIPFVFVYHPAVLYKLQVVFEWAGEDPVQSSAMIDLTTVSWLDLGWIVFAFTLAMWLLTSALIGFEKYRLNWLERILRMITAIALLFSNIMVATSALIVALLLVVVHRMNRKTAAFSNGWR